jgi:hypothetical protein
MEENIIALLLTAAYRAMGGWEGFHYFYGAP